MLYFVAHFASLTAVYASKLLNEVNTPFGFAFNFIKRKPFLILTVGIEQLAKFLSKQY